MAQSPDPVAQSASKLFENLLKSDLMQVTNFKSKVVRHMLSEGEHDVDELISAMKLAKKAEPLILSILRASEQAGDISEDSLAPVQLELANLLARLNSGRQSPAASFEDAAKSGLPDRAPEVWMERDRSKGETPVAFLKRVWGPYWDALYQDDIKRLGDSKLGKAVRTYCHRHNMSASEVLPPPRQARIERALAEADPNSPEAVALREKLSSRQRSARWRQSHKPT